MKQLYPELDPISVQHLDAGTPHVVYVEECGKADRIPVLFLYGEPG
jgi:proline iminopeptidase